MSPKTFLKNFIIVLLGIMIIASLMVYFKLSYSKSQLDSISSNPIETGAWSAYFYNVKTISQNNIKDEDITGPTLTNNGTEFYLDVNLVPNSNYSFSFDFVNQSSTDLKVLDIYKRVIRSQDNELATGSSISFKVRYDDGTDVNIDDIIEPNESKKVIVSISADENVISGNYKFLFEITNSFLK